MKRNNFHKFQTAKPEFVLFSCLLFHQKAFLSIVRRMAEVVKCQMESPSVEKRFLQPCPRTELNIAHACQHTKLLNETEINFNEKAKRKNPFHKKFQMHCEETAHDFYLETDVR